MFNGGYRQTARSRVCPSSLAPHGVYARQGECDSARRSALCQARAQPAESRQRACRMVLVTGEGAATAGPSAHQLAKQGPEAQGEEGVRGQPKSSRLM